MRSSVAWIFVLPIAALQIPSIFAPFFEPQSLLSNETLSKDEHELLKRDGNCPSNYNSCSTLAARYGGACCTVGSFCTTDKAHAIACCPTGATCTGTASTGVAATRATNGPTMTGTASYVSNTYFPFPIMPQSYVNSAACNSAYSDCQANYAACTNDLQGNIFGVTIVAPNGAGVTVAPSVQSLGVASASSICNSLSSVACYNIASSSCAAFGTATTTGGEFIVGTTSNPAARPTVGCIAAAGVMAGVGLGIARQLV